MVFFMFVCNVKMNSSIIKRIAIAIVALIISMVFIIVGFRFYNSTSRVIVKDMVDTSRLEVNSNNYTNILKDSHNNIDKYVGKKIKFTGFVYRVYDFTEKQFVLAREMVISSDNQAVIVGFLCECDNGKDFNDGEWIEVEGTITKGIYHGDMPIIKIKSINRTDTPKDEYVYPPDDNYINSEA